MNEEKDKMDAAAETESQPEKVREEPEKEAQTESKSEKKEDKKEKRFGKKKDEERAALEAEKEVSYSFVSFSSCLQSFWHQGLFQ